jgi:hypothetical protein
MSSLPPHGRIDCTLCYTDEPVTFDHTCRTEGHWRIKANPLAWGNPHAEIVVLGFSKGPNQAGALATAKHDDIACKGSRTSVGKILAHLSLIPPAGPEELRREVDRLIAERSGRYHFGSLVRCTVERLDRKSGAWKGSGGGMLDKFVATPFGQSVVSNCSRRFLGSLPHTTRLVVMFGLGTRCNYVDEAFEIWKSARPGPWTRLNEIAYTDGNLTVVHVEHFAAQGALIPSWLGVTPNDRARLGLLARETVRHVLASR